LADDELAFVELFESDDPFELLVSEPLVSDELDEPDDELSDELDEPDDELSDELEDPEEAEDEDDDEPLRLSVL
jgi:hypothetical protein